MKKLNFKAVPCRNVEGKLEPIDLSKKVGNYIYQNTPDLGELDLAQRIYKDGEVEVEDPVIESIRGYINRGFMAFVKKAFEEMVSQVQEI